MASKSVRSVRDDGPEKKDKRRKSNSFVYYGTIIIFIITVIAFIVTPSLGSGAGDGNDFVFGSWNGKEIAFAQGGYFANQVKLVKDQLSAQGYADTGDQYFAYQVWRRAFENTAIHLAILEMAKKAGIHISDDLINREMANHYAFQENGQFSKRRYRETSSTFKAALRDEISETSLKDRYISDSIQLVAGKAETDFIKEMASPQRSIEYINIPFSAFPDSARLAWAKERPGLFRQTRLSRISVTSSAKDAQTILDRIKEGVISFEDAARNQSRDAYAAKGGDMGRLFAWELASDFQDQSVVESIMLLNTGEISAVYETMAGAWVFFRADQPASEPDWDAADTARSISDYLNSYEKGIMEDWAIQQARDFISNASENFETALMNHSLVLKETEAFALNYGNVFDLGYFSLFGKLDTSDRAELTGASSNEAFLRAVFSLPAGQLSEPLTINANVIVFRVKEISRAEESTLDLIDAYYASVLEDGMSRDIARNILESPKLKDNFLTTFTRIYSSGE